MTIVQVCWVLHHQQHESMVCMKLKPQHYMVKMISSLYPLDYTIYHIPVTIILLHLKARVCFYDWFVQNVQPQDWRIYILTTVENWMNWAKAVYQPNKYLTLDIQKQYVQYDLHLINLRRKYLTTWKQNVTWTEHKVEIWKYKQALSS